MHDIYKQFRNYYTPKRLLLNAGIMTAATIFFIVQRPDETLLITGFAGIAAIYFGFFIYRGIKNNA